MRIVFGVLSLLVVAAIIGILSKKQLAAVSTLPAVPGLPASAPAPSGNVSQQSQQIQQQYKQAIDGAMQPRPVQDDTK